MALSELSIPPIVALNQKFRDMSLLGEAIDWDLDFRQLEAGKLRASALLLAGRRSMAMRVGFNRKFHQRGCPPKGMATFGFPDIESGPLRWDGCDAQPGALLNFNEGRLEGVNPGNFWGHTISFQEEFLEEIAAILGVRLPNWSQLNAIPIWNPRDGEHDRLRNILTTLEQAAISEGNKGLLPFGETFNFDLAACVCRILSDTNQIWEKEGAPFRGAVLRRTLEVLEHPDQAHLKVAEICSQVGTSLSSLERAFREEFDVSPKKYINYLRLAAIRSELLKAAPGTLINDVANQWGIWHMGRFASDYRAQFGELPSQTLNAFWS